MRHTVSCVFQDGAVRPVRDDFADLTEACRYALRLAERHGSDPGDGHGPPAKIQVTLAGMTLFAVKVFPGGLAPR